MATIVLQAAGAFLGGALGPAGAVIGRAAGALAGYAIDQAVINGTRRLEGGRLNDPRPFSAEDGAALPRVYGTVRVGGTLIWATRFEEVATAERTGGKGSPKITNYSYFANVAFALSEGPIAGVRRIWADGRELDQTLFEIRVYKGSEDELPDPLIEAKQGEGNAAPFRGTAYVVFDRLPLSDFGNRIPQFGFEVLRPAGTLPAKIKAVTLIPGSTEYGLSPSPVTLTIKPGETEILNRSVLHAGTDIGAALDELQALCPNLEHVGLVATWFGNDLRAGSCTIRPMVAQKDVTGQSQPWRVSGLERADAEEVSRHEGSAAYGGAPSDRSVTDAILDLKRRGLKVTLYPFIMMDVPHNNTLPDPHGGTAQPPYPWRGRITCHPAPGTPQTSDGSAAAGEEIAAFVGRAASSDFALEDDTVAFNGNPAEWSYRRFLLHFAHLAKAAGGVDAFLIGSELRGLTTVRDHAGAFPFVAALMDLAADVRALLGPATKITYGADWSEYSGYQPIGSADRIFHLDPLWSHSAVDAVGIDNYMPLSDWRDNDWASGNPDGFQSQYDVVALRGQIARGEGYDWFYASLEDRHARRRTPITDGAYNKPWIYRYKDLVSWWSNPHNERQNGVEAATATDWIPCSKPIWFTELGCPASDKGPNQPNVFPDPKSSESAFPYYSTGGRSDSAQHSFIAAHQAHWDGDAEGFERQNNPLSPIYGGPMVDPDRIYLWAWDARPFPAFPSLGDQWRDGDNWLLGHWLNGRLSTATTADLIAAVLQDHDLPLAQTHDSPGSLHGYVMEEPGTAREALEPLVSLFGLGVGDDGGTLRFAGPTPTVPISVSELVVEDGVPVVESTRAGEGELPTELTLGFRDPFAAYQGATARAVDPGRTGLRQQALALSAVLESDAAASLAADRLRDHWAGREEISFALEPGRTDVTPGTTVRLPFQKPSVDFLVTSVEAGSKRSIRAKQVRRIASSPWRVRRPLQTAIVEPMAGRPASILLDLPMLPGETDPARQLRLATHAKPWKTLAVFSASGAEGYVQRGTVAAPATMGQLVAPLFPGPIGRIDRANVLELSLLRGELANRTRLEVLNGSGTAAVSCANGQWEVLQFERAKETAADTWQLSALLRAQLGTEDAMQSGAAAGGSFVLLDDRALPAGLMSSEVGLERQWRIGPAGYPVTGEYFTQLSATGGQRSRMPLAPVHLRARKTATGWLLTWIRRSRIDADDWEASEIPLGEDSETYLVEIAATGSSEVRRRVQTSVPFLNYPVAEAASDFGGLPNRIAVAVRQVSRTVGTGIAAKADLPLL
ncbi:MAG TPA: glycoside hydrolase TIM-barrel-like domain-containing protein [Tianweitania sediminis]|nr:glycoside hydrolase TIM-barrel-like domain-containing protein [Tianweitania sediminis]